MWSLATDSDHRMSSPHRLNYFTLDSGPLTPDERCPFWFVAYLYYALELGFDLISLFCFALVPVDSTLSTVRILCTTSRYVLIMVASLVGNLSTLEHILCTRVASSQLRFMIYR